MRQPRRESGFTFIAVMLAVAFHGVALAAVGTLWSTVQKREREKELLFIGEQFRRALISYAGSGAGAAGQLPTTLDDLLKDPRTPNVKRHLRKIFVDPMTGTTEWGLIKTPDGKGILGVHSLSEEPPLRVGNFEGLNKQFENKTKYSEWKFLYSTSVGVAEKVPGQQQPGEPTAPGTLAPGMRFGAPQPTSPGAPAPAPTPSPGLGPAPLQPAAPAQ